MNNDYQESSKLWKRIDKYCTSGPCNVSCPFLPCGDSLNNDSRFKCSFGYIMDHYDEVKAICDNLDRKDASIGHDDLVKWADMLEDLMTKTAFRKDISVEERALWWAAKPLYEAIQKLLRRKHE